MNETGGWTRAYKAMALVSAVPISTIVAGLLGAELDSLLGWRGPLTAGLGLLGFAAGIFQLFRGLKAANDDDPRHHPP
jgi:hypothetical protein